MVKVYLIITKLLLQEKLIEKMEFLAVVFYDMEDDPEVENLQVNFKESFFYYWDFWHIFNPKRKDIYINM